MSQGAWSLFDSDSDTETVELPSTVEADTQINSTPNVSCVTTSGLTNSSRLYEKYFPDFPLSQEEQKKMFENQVELIKRYHANPSIHPDVIVNPSTSPVSYSHIDGFSSAPMFQSPLIKVDINMETRGGNRGIIATEDIPPGTLLLAEKCHVPFKTKKQCSANGTRPELEAMQDLLFDYPVSTAAELIRETNSLYPHNLSHIEPEHQAFLRSVYDDAILAALNAIPDERKSLIALLATNDSVDVFNSSNSSDTIDEINTSKAGDILLLFLCRIHFNAFPVGINLHIGMINHSCRPNAVKLALIQKNGSNKMKKALSISEIRSTQTIKKGEEVFICYIPESSIDLSLPFRQTYLHRQFQFYCTCSLCLEEQLVLEKQTEQERDIAQIASTSLLYLEDLMSYFYQVPTKQDLEEAQLMGPSQDFPRDENKVSSVEDLEKEFHRDPVTLALDILRKRLQVPDNIADSVFVFVKASQIYKLHYAIVGPIHQDQIAALLYSSSLALLKPGVLESLSAESLIELSTTSGPLNEDTIENRQVVRIISPQALRSLQAVLSCSLLMAGLQRGDHHVNVFGNAPTPQLASILADISIALQKLIALGTLGQRLALNQSEITSRIGDKASFIGHFEVSCGKMIERISSLYNTAAIDDVLGLHQ